MTKKLFVLTLTILFTVGLCLPASADIIIQANPNIASASIMLSSSMSAQFICSTRSFCDISVTSVKLQVKNSDGSWTSGTTVPSPPGVTNAASLNKTMSYSGYCTIGKTYRITATFVADGESVSRTSGQATYN